MRGSFEAIETANGAGSVVTAGERAFATGWALAGDASPVQVSVAIDGRQGAVSAAFFDRPGLRDAVHATSPAGWRVPVETAGLPSG